MVDGTEQAQAFRAAPLVVAPAQIAAIRLFMERNPPTSKMALDHWTLALCHLDSAEALAGLVVKLDLAQGTDVLAEPSAEPLVPRREHEGRPIDPATGLPPGRPHP